VKFQGCVDCKITCMAEASETGAGWSLQAKKDHESCGSGSLDTREQILV
jgi:hypothetical protein